MQNILFTCAGRRNYLINYFKAALGINGKVIAVDKQNFVSSLAQADIAIQVPSIYDKLYIDKLLEIIKLHKVTVLISLNDLELPILSKNRNIFEDNGVKMLVSNQDVIEVCFDKWKTHKFLKKIGLNTPKTLISLSKAVKLIENGMLKFPLVLKPRWGSGSFGIEFTESLEELDLSYRLLKIKLEKTHIQQGENCVLIQEKLKGLEYGVDVVNDFKGDFFGVFARKKFLMRSGETNSAMSVIDERFNLIGEKIGGSLGHIGIMDCDFFMDNDKIYVLELNPRFGGGYPFSHEAGINIPAIYLEWLNGNDDVKGYDKYKAGIVFSKYDELIQISKLS